MVNLKQYTDDLANATRVTDLTSTDVKEVVNTLKKVGRNLERLESEDVINTTQVGLNLKIFIDKNINQFFVVQVENSIGSS